MSPGFIDESCNTVTQAWKTTIYARQFLNPDLFLSWSQVGGNFELLWPSKVNNSQLNKTIFTEE